MSKHAIAALFLLGSLALAATTVAQTADSAATPDRTIALWNGKDLSNWAADVPKRDAARQGRRDSVFRVQGALMNTRPGSPAALLDDRSPL